ncbi:hypothetical protein BBP40_012520 [Aspergillus hancockii]|nr:hypothetical protein BBP40_012520 [Aspergillus hancockii]
MSTPSPSPTCPFCSIANTYPPVRPTAFIPEDSNSQKTPSDLAAPKPDISPISLAAPSDSAESTTHLILSTEYVLAFLDIMPLTRGHVLVIPRAHYEKLGDVDVRASREIGQWLPIISRVVMRTLFGEDDGSSWNWNVVQNNGVRAAQQVPHAHFHIIPRPSLDPAPNAARMSFAMFGRGQREELDDEEGDRE